METRAHTHTPPPRRVLRSLALLLALLACGCLAAAAAARPARVHHTSSCATSRHARHASSKRCSKHHAGKGAHKTKKPAPKPATPAPKLAPAVCEDGTAPVREASGVYDCEDGSEPACTDGSDPLHPTAVSAPMCRVTHEGLECGPASKGECGLELACEEEATEAPQGCEHGSALEEDEEELEG